MNKVINCPNCGALIHNDKCDFCGAVFIDWATIDVDTPFYIKFKHNNKVIRAKCYMVNFNVNYGANRDILYSDDMPYMVRKPTQDITINTEFRVIPDENNILGIQVNLDEIEPGVKPW